MKSSISEETKSLRLPRGTAAKIRMLTGQPFSTFMRCMALNVIEKYEADAAAKKAKEQQS
jgi:hypothetical protein